MLYDSMIRESLSLFMSVLFSVWPCSQHTEISFTQVPGSERCRTLEWYDPYDEVQQASFSALRFAAQGVDESVQPLERMPVPSSCIPQDSSPN